MDVPAAVTRMVEATNAGDSKAFVDAFADDAYLNDWGREFAGTDGVAAWNESDNIGKQAHFEIQAARAENSGYVVTLQVTGGGFNGTSDFYFEVEGDRVQRMVIRAD